MGLYLGKDKISALRTIEKTTQSMKAYLEAGGKCRDNNVVSFDGCWQASDWENITNCSSMFNSSSKITSIPPMDTGNVTDMSYMFNSCYELKSIPALDTGNVTNMRYMFNSCYRLTSVPNIDTSKVTDMRYMFAGCNILTSIPPMDTGNVTDMGGMFNSCRNLESIHMYGMKVSFDIESSTSLTRKALVEILNNLATVTTSPKLYMGVTNLAKLTDEDKAIATGKGWTLK